MVVYALLVIAGFLLIAWVSVHYDADRGPMIGAPGRALSAEGRHDHGFALRLRTTHPRRPSPRDEPL